MIAPRGLYDRALGLVQNALEEGRVTKLQLSEDSGMSYAAIRAWYAGTRNPRPESVRRLADGLRRRGEQLRTLADELERVAARPRDTEWTPTR